MICLIGNFTPRLILLLTCSRPPFAQGKTGCTDVLAASLSEIVVKHVVQRMNPKAITAPQMFGRLDGDEKAALGYIRRGVALKREHARDRRAINIGVQNPNTLAALRKPQIAIQQAPFFPMCV